MLEDETCYRAAQAKDSRFDGRFLTGVISTGIYCRPSCPAMTPKRRHMAFFASAAGAQSAGFRACKRCRPGAAPGSPEWNSRADLVGRAMRLIADGFVDREGVSGLAAHLGYSTRQLHRQLLAELGASPLALARAQRAETARLLLETTALPVSAVCFAAGFASIRQFNDAMRQLFDLTPSELRREGARHAGSEGATALTLRLSYRPPLALGPLLAFLGERAVPGVEEYDSESYRRVLNLPHDLAVVTLSPGTAAPVPFVSARLQLNDLRDLTAAVGRCRRLFDLDADPVTVDGALGADALLAPLVARRPGIRIPGAVDPAELAVRAILGQQISVAGARTIAARLASRYGRPLPTPDGALSTGFPDAETLAGSAVTDLPLPISRGRALVTLCDALASGKLSLDPGADRKEAEHALLALPGIGPWTAAYVRMRALSDPDAFLHSDLGLRRALDSLGVASAPTAAIARAEQWRPWRAYALQHLWASLADTRSTTHDRQRPSTLSTRARCPAASRDARSTR